MSVCDTRLEIGICKHVYGEISFDVLSIISSDEPPPKTRDISKILSHFYKVSLKRHSPTQGASVLFMTSTVVL